MASQRTKKRRSTGNASNADSRMDGSKRKRQTMTRPQRAGSARSQSKRTNGSSPQGRDHDPRPASEKTEKYRFAKNVEGLGTAAEREYQHYAEIDPWELDDELPDVLLDVPVVKLDSLHFELDNLDAHLALNAYVLDLVKLKVGVDVHLGRVRLDIRGVEAQALVKVRLDHVAAIVDRVMTTLDRNPELLESLGAAVEDIGAGGGDMLGEAGEAVEDAGEGAEQALEHIGKGAGEGVGEIGQGAGRAVSGVGKGAGQAVGDVGEGAGEAVGDVGEGAGEAVGDIGEGAGEAVGDVGEGAGEAVGNLDQTVQGVGRTVGQTGEAVGEAAEGVGEGVHGAERAVGEVGQGAGEAVGGIAQGVGGAAGQLEQAAAGLVGGGGNGGGEGMQAGRAEIAKLAAKLVAKELTSAAKEEARELGLAATRKAKEVGERRKQRKAEELNATEAAIRTAEELEVDLDLVEGSGPEGRITIRDVRRAQDETTS